MATALTGSLGWTGLHPVQLGGPPLISTFAKTIPTAASPLIARLYQNDGVNFLGSFSPLNLPSLTTATANGGMEQVQLEVASRTPTVTQGNVIRLTFQGGDGSIVYSGVVEDLPDIATAGKTQHLILLSPFGFELDDVHSTSIYLTSVDLSQVIRDAVAQTIHCSCDQLSVPSATGIAAPTDSTGSLDFRQQTLKQQIDTCRSIAGPTWFWHVDELGRVWFQSMASGAVHTFLRGPHYEERTSAASIQDRKNHIVVVGGIPTGSSANAIGIYDGASQATIGVRALFPPLQLPNVNDQTTITTIAANVGAVLDRIWNRVNLKVHQPYSQRVHASRPGGAMMRYWEPTVSSIPESGSGSGTYSGPYIVQRVEYDGLHQTVTAGDIPVTSQNDVENMVKSYVARTVSNAVFVTAAPLNQPVAIAATGLIINTISSLGYTSQAPAQNITSVTFVATTPSIAVTFTLTRTAHVLILFSVTAITSGGSGTFAYGRVNVIQTSTPASMFTSDKNIKWDKGSAGEVTALGWAFSGNAVYAGLVAGTYTAQVEIRVDSGQTCLVDQGYIEVFQAGT